MGERGMIDMKEKGRVFEVTAAVRERVPLLVGLVGPSGSGKTYSALRIATGIQKVSGGEIFGIDTEARRMRHYADIFKFQHLDFKAPFGPLDYLAAVEYCVSKGARNIIVDSMSHEHEGPGGVLEMHEAAVDRMAGDDLQKRERVKMLAWVRPKSERRRLLNSIVQMNVNFIFCFRAKEKMKIERGKEPIPLGWQAIAGEEFIYEMTMALLLPPASGGAPNLAPTEIGERALLKIPQQFRGLLKAGAPLDESLGAALAHWAAGDERTAGSAPAAVATPPAADTAAADRKQALADVKMHLATLPDAEAKKTAVRDAFGGASTWQDVQALPTEQLLAGLARLHAPSEPAEPERDPTAPTEEEEAELGAVAAGSLSPAQVAELTNLANRAGVPLADIQALHGGWELAEIEILGLDAAALEAQLVREIRELAKK
jgi:ABC-type dipeptide/oligopeptide/nickel transport system ATPase subunit